MKNLKHFLLAGIVSMLAIPANAQFANSGNNNSASVSENGYNRISVAYDATMFGGDGSKYFNEDGDKGATFNGFNVQYLHGFSISQTHPLFLEVGVRLNAGFHKYSYDYDDDEYSFSFSKMSLIVPVNVAYRFNCGENLTVAPYTGLHLGFNILGKGKYSEEDDSYSFFDKDDVGKDDKWNRIQCGWQIGCGLNYKALYFGLEYGLDFNALAKKLNTSNFSVNIGYNF